MCADAVVVVLVIPFMYILSSVLVQVLDLQGWVVVFMPSIGHYRRERCTEEDRCCASVEGVHCTFDKEGNSKR